MMNHTHVPRWMRTTLLLAGAYNLVWGALVVLFPGATLWLFLERPPLYPQFWQCIGMIIGVFGIGYLAASTNPLRHWPIVLVGLLGKIFGPIGFLEAVARGSLPWSFGWTIITNDLIWWVPFGLILLGAYRAALAEDPVLGGAEEVPLEQALAHYHTNRGISLRELSAKKPVLVVFLRHLGCTFCREAIAELGKRAEEIQASGTVICLVHMGEDRELGAFAKRHGLGRAHRISDPARVLYRSFGLRRGNLKQLLGWKVWKRGLEAGVAKGHWVGWLEGDGLQMPGVFLLKDGHIERAFRHETAADQPDYQALAACPIGPPSPRESAA